MHKRPQRNWLSSYRSASGKFRCGATTFAEHVFPTAAALADIISEIDYSWRLDPYNHWLPPFDRCITCMVDTLPIYIPMSHDWAISQLFYQPKYLSTVIKMQLGCTLHGDIVLWSGPHLGIASDIGIWNRTWDLHPFQVSE